MRASLFALCVKRPQAPPRAGLFIAGSEALHGWLAPRARIDWHHRASSSCGLFNPVRRESAMRRANTLAPFLIALLIGAVALACAAAVA